MKTDEENTEFLKKDARDIYSALTPRHTPKWGHMDPQQMLEHIGLTLRVSNGARDVELVTPPARLEKLKNISLLSDRPLPVNFQNPALPVVPMPHHFQGFGQARGALWNELDAFFKYFEGKDAAYTRVHNIFGPLNYSEWLLFHYKHFMHHAMQFGLVPEFTRL